MVSSTFDFADNTLANPFFLTSATRNKLMPIVISDTAQMPFQKGHPIRYIWANWPRPKCQMLVHDFSRMVASSALPKNSKATRTQFLYEPLNHYAYNADWTFGGCPQGAVHNLNIYKYYCMFTVLILHLENIIETRISLWGWWLVHRIEILLCHLNLEWKM